jgi:hypothetical protein
MAVGEYSGPGRIDIPGTGPLFEAAAPPMIGGEEQQRRSAGKSVPNERSEKS